MKTLWKLLLFEMRRMVNYKILPVSLVTSVLWIILFFLLSKAESQTIAPLLLFTDVVMMSILLTGASYHLERQEGTVKSLLVTPAGIGAIVVSKVLASLVLSLESAVVTCGALYFIHGITLDYGLLLAAVLVSGAAHAVLGYSFSLLSRDFSGLLGYISLYILVFALPPILLYMHVIPAEYDWLMIFSPADAAQTLLGAAFTGIQSMFKLLLSFGYLAALTAALMLLHVIPGFRRHAARG